MVVVVLNAAGPVIFAVTGSGRPVNYWIALASEVALGLILTYRVNRQSTKWRLLGVAIVIAGFAMVAAITNLVVTLTIGAPLGALLSPCG